MQEEFTAWVKLAFASTATLLTSLLGDWDAAINILVIIIACDYITGVSRAFFEKKLSSEIGARGIVKKVMIFVVVILASQLDKFLPADVAIVRTATIYFYVANEGLSILENLTIMGIPLPTALKDKLMQVQKDKNL